MNAVVRDFKEAKRLVLVACYDAMMDDQAAEWLIAEYLLEGGTAGIPITYLRKAVQSLVDERLLKTRRGAGGPQLFTITEQGILVVEQQIAPERSNQDSVIPASDRLVQLGHNGGPEDDLVKQATMLRQRIKTGNDLGSLTIEEAVAAEAELGQLEEAFRSDSVRIGYAWPLSQSTLKWIADKAGSAAIGKAATTLLAAIAAFFGITI